MVYLYAGLGMVMLSGIMAIFEMGLALTGQTLLPVPPDDYLSSQSMKDEDKIFLKALADETTSLVDDKTFPDLVSEEGLCSALNRIDNAGWSLISEGRFESGCYLHTVHPCVLKEDDKKCLHRAVVKENPDNNQLSYQLFSCALSGDDERCSFELE